MIRAVKLKSTLACFVPTFFSNFHVHLILEKTRLCFGSTSRRLINSFKHSRITKSWFSFQLPLTWIFHILFSRPSFYLFFFFFLKTNFVDECRVSISIFTSSYSTIFEWKEWKGYLETIETIILSKWIVIK